MILCLSFRGSYDQTSSCVTFFSSLSPAIIKIKKRSSYCFKTYDLLISPLLKAYIVNRETWNFENTHCLLIFFTCHGHTSPLILLDLLIYVLPIVQDHRYSVKCYSRSLIEQEFLFICFTSFWYELLFHITFVSKFCCLQTYSYWRRYQRILRGKRRIA